MSSSMSYTHSTDMLQQLVIKEEMLPEHQELNLSVNQKDVKQVQEEVWKSNNGQQLHWLKTEKTKFCFARVPVKTENDDEMPQSSQVLQNSDMQPLLVIKEETVPEHQEDIKEEKLWISQQREQLQQLEEADLTKFGFIVKSENDDEKTESSQLHQNRSDKSTEAEPIASSSSVHKTLTAETDGEDDGGPQPASNSGPNSHLQPDTSGRSSDSCGTETDDGYDWKQTRELKLHFTCRKNINIVSSSKCNVAETQFMYSQVSGKKPFDCSECGQRFGEMCILKGHMIIHTGQKQFGCSECGRRFGRKSGLKRHMIIHTGQKQFSCLECGRRFGHKCNLNKHMIIHTGHKQFGCSECGRRFGRKSGLKRHMIIHTGQKQFSCLECSQRFRQKSDLKRHMLNHTGHKQFVCSECGRRFGQKSTLKRHMLIHTGHKQFVCSECGQRFAQKGHLKRHMISHTGQKQFACSECGRRFGLKGHLKTHIIHTGHKQFGCSECGRRFGRKDTLITHMIIHTGHKQFACSECGRRFGHKGNLNKHMVIHTGHKQFGCPECGRRFGHKSNLNRHMIIHIGPKDQENTANQSVQTHLLPDNNI